MNVSGRKVSLRTGLDEAFLALVLSFAEESVKAFGFSRVEADRIRLASEEVFLYLCGITRTSQPFEIEVSSGIYYVKARFLFDAAAFDPYALNLTARVMPDGQGLEDLGLLIASRSVDHFYIQHNLREGLGFVLVKEKVYEDAAETVFPDAPPALDNFTFVSPDSVMIKRFARNVCRSYDETFFPSRYRCPAKVVDMAASGDYHAIVATGSGRQSREIGGGILWRAVGKGMIEFFGPYIFDTVHGKEVAAGLTDHLLGQVAKTNATFAATSYGTPDLPPDYFELLNEIEYRLPGGGIRLCPFFYRQLHEDMGCQVFSHPDLIPFLRAQHDRLVLPREILPITWEGERRDAHSAFIVHFDRPQQTVRLRPLWDGEDAVRNVADHVTVLTNEGFANIFFEMDLGQPWQSLLAPALLKNGFAPVLLLPDAGQGDIVVFQLSGFASPAHGKGNTET
jgi:hypothetical protein